MGYRLNFMVHLVLKVVLFNVDGTEVEGPISVYFRDFQVDRNAGALLSWFSSRNRARFQFVPCGL